MGNWTLLVTSTGTHAGTSRWCLEAPDQLPAPVTNNFPTSAALPDGCHCQHRQWYIPDHFVENLLQKVVWRATTHPRKGCVLVHTSSSPWLHVVNTSASTTTNTYNGAHESRPCLPQSLLRNGPNCPQGSILRKMDPRGQFLTNTSTHSSCSCRTPHLRPVLGHTPPQLNRKQPSAVASASGTCLWQRQETGARQLQLSATVTNDFQTLLHLQLQMAATVTNDFQTVKGHSPPHLTRSPQNCMLQCLSSRVSASSRISASRQAWRQPFISSGPARPTKHGVAEQFSASLAVLVTQSIRLLRRGT